MTVISNYSMATTEDNLHWFKDAKFGLFIHWGLYSIPACGEWVMSEKEMTVEEYRTYF